jgi:5-formyltetrahydrofolate cyclo-ligase
MEPLSKEALRRAALEARKAYVRTISDAERCLLEEQLAHHLTSMCAGAAIVGGYAPLGSEISPQLAIEEARAVGRIVAYPAFDHPAKPF